MSPSIIAGFVGAGLVGLGLYALIVNPEPLKKLLAFNLIGSGVFLVFGIVARRGAVGAFPFDPVPQAMVITGIVVAFRGERARGRAHAPPRRGVRSRHARSGRLDEAGRRSRGRMTPAETTTAGRRSARARDPAAGGRNPRVVRARRPQRRTDRSRLRAARARDRAGDSRRGLAHGAADRLRDRRSLPAARHCLEGRRHIGGHAGDDRADRPGCRTLRPRGLRDAVEARGNCARRSPSGSCSRRSRPRSRSSSSAATSSTSMSRSSCSPSPPCRSPAWRAGRRPSPPRCAISSSPCSARSSTCSAPRSFTARSGRSTSRFWPKGCALCRRSPRPRR